MMFTEENLGRIARGLDDWHRQQLRTLEDLLNDLLLKGDDERARRIVGNERERIDARRRCYNECIKLLATLERLGNLR